MSQTTQDLISPRQQTESEVAAQAYIDLLKNVLTRFIAQDEFAELIFNRRTWQEQVFAPLEAILATKGSSFASGCLSTQRPA